jgi:hypothetical protein
MAAAEACQSASHLACSHPAIGFLIVFGLVAFTSGGAALAAVASMRRGAGADSLRGKGRADEVSGDA